MAQITAAQVKELREKTGAGMMECKAALTEANGDLDEAVKILRKKGLAAAGKKAGRITSDGLVSAEIRGNVGVLVEVNCETDFVAQTDEFKALVKTLAEVVASNEVSDVDAVLSLDWPNDPEGHTIAQVISTKIAKTGENMSLRRFVRYVAGANDVLGSYVHGNGKIGVLVELEAADPAKKDVAESTAREVAMHAAATEPRYKSRDEVTEQDLATEQEIARDQALKSGKPEAVVEKIVSGKMEKFYGETVLLEQPFVRDDKLTVSQMLDQRGKDANGKLSVVRFTRFKLGEGLQKRSDDFAAEVMAQANR
ncbi:MAG TPA: translation elongation factor Ts [Thermoanaerobaculia bacterium]